MIHTILVVLHDPRPSMQTPLSHIKLLPSHPYHTHPSHRMLAAGAQPSEVTYTALLSMWGNSRHPRASDRVVEVFQHMRSAGRRLDTVGYR